MRHRRESVRAFNINEKAETPGAEAQVVSARPSKGPSVPRRALGAQPRLVSAVPPALRLPLLPPGPGALGLRSAYSEGRAVTLI